MAEKRSTGKRGEGRAIERNPVGQTGATAIGGGEILDGAALRGGNDGGQRAAQGVGHRGIVGRQLGTSGPHLRGGHGEWRVGKRVAIVARVAHVGGIARVAVDHGTALIGGTSAGRVEAVDRHVEIGAVIPVVAVGGGEQAAEVDHVERIGGGVAEAVARAKVGRHGLRGAGATGSLETHDEIAVVEGRGSEGGTGEERGTADESGFECAVGFHGWMFDC